MRRLPLALLVLATMLVSAPARAFVPQTITVDGVNDFDPSNLLSDDRSDTQTGCAPVALPMDLGRVYITNDANFLYLGIEFSQTCYCDMNLGIALDVGSAGGNVTDAFGRRIGWANVPFKPDFTIYDVTPTSCNTFNYEAFYKDTASTWQNRSTLINPSYGSGANGLGIVDSLNFKELKIPLSVLGVGAGTTLHLDLWTTQEGANKGPLDALASDNVQMSHPTGTTYDTTAVVQMTTMFAYTVLNAIDNIAPTVTNAQAVNFPLQANRNFSLTTNKIDVLFSEPVELASSQVASHYAFSGPVTRTVISAVRDNAALGLVHLTLNSAINANAAAYVITATLVKDIAGNTIVANGSTNVGAFFIQNLVFNGDFHIGLCSGTFAPADTFAIEGSLNPLTFSICDNTLLTDANGDSIYTATVPFCLPRDPSTLKGEADLEWKFSRLCSTFEPLSGNRHYHLTSDNGASAPITAAWNDDTPANFTAHPIDVVFKVDATRRNPTGATVITLLGSQLPLGFTQPGVLMRDNGVAPDQTANDKIYTVRVRFPNCTFKNVGWKVDVDGVIECGGQGDRSLVLDDALYGIVGSPQGELVLPARGIDRCEVTDKPLTVVYKLDMRAFSPLPSQTPGPDSVAVMGDRTPLRFDYPVAGQLMFDNGATGGDVAAHDGIFTRSVTFPDSTPFVVSFKYWKNGVFECASIGNRQLTLNDVAFNSGTPIVRLLNVWDYCTEPTSVPNFGPDRSGADFAVLNPCFPNPIGRSTRFGFDLRREGRVTLSIFDVSGRRVSRVLDASLKPGLHSITWDGRDAHGSRLASGVYVYELAMGGQRLTRRMIVTK